jgi:hypothetical protein
MMESIAETVLLVLALLVLAPLGMLLVVLVAAVWTLARVIGSKLRW